MIVYILEWGIDIRYSSTVQFVNTTVFPTLEDACSRAMEFTNNIPSICKYNIATHKIIQKWHNIPVLDAKIGAL